MFFVHKNKYISDCFQTLSFSKIDNPVLFSKSHCRTLSFRITWRLLFSGIGRFYFSENCRFSFFWNLREQSYCLHSSGIPLNGPPHDRGGTRGRPPEIQGKEKGIRRRGFQRGIKVIPGLRQLYRTSSNLAELHKTWQTPPNCAKLYRNPTETNMCPAGRFPPCWESPCPTTLRRTPPRSSGRWAPIWRTGWWRKGEMIGRQWSKATPYSCTSSYMLSHTPKSHHLPKL